MQTQFGRGRYVDTIAGRTIQSGGSVGGNKKPGIVTFGATWQRGNMGNFLRRASHRVPTLAFSILNTTRHPTQFARNGYYASHSGQLG